MAESNNADRNEVELSENIRVAVDEEFDVGEGPHFFSPYPERLVQIKRPETRGGRDVVKVINQSWPAEIDELEELSREMFEDGYSGSFIRSVLRTHYIPEDRYNGEIGADRQPAEATMPEEEIIVENGADSMAESEEEWHRIFRYGIRVALAGNVSEEEAVAAFNSGFVEGGKLKEEMDIEAGRENR